MEKINEPLVASMWQVRGDEIVARAKKELERKEKRPSPTLPKHGAGVKSPVVAQVVMEESRRGDRLVCGVCGFTCPVLPTMVIDAQRRGSWPVHCEEAMGVE